MNLTQIIEKENINSEAKNISYIPVKKEGTGRMIYSPKLNIYIPLNAGNPKGEIQKHNVGLGPGNWY
jgi:hypothetical protein